MKLLTMKIGVTIISSSKTNSTLPNLTTSIITKTKKAPNGAFYILYSSIIYSNTFFFESTIRRIGRLSSHQ